MASKFPKEDKEVVSVNILISGTPGVGKSTHASELATRMGLRYVNINELALKKVMYHGSDSVVGDARSINEEMVQDKIEHSVKKGGCVVDYHSCDMFPKSWFRLVFVLRTDNTVLYDRLEKRGYNEVKMKNNIECEIFQELLEEAREHFGIDKVIELFSNEVDDIENNLDIMTGLIKDV